MVCIYCGSKTKVSNSRSSGKGTWRRRECLSCKAIFTTREQVELEGALRVQQKDGSLEPFSRDKLLISVNDSLSHRKSALQDAIGLTDTVISNIYELQSNGVLDLLTLIDKTQSILSKFDHASEVYYRAHYM
jgi:transcriptional regulator NrdR family protein